ncbi:PAS domain S-box protein [Dyella choica]|uniref:histidine kinase n=1 Tax=Dyella choica TaxID=1927959 RepID=A0A432M0D1_9GAMM|nr:PAS domain S-box protein [Dyella choica]RUL70130.1 PAS domain S-box protein [Dyella choica]
MKNADISDILAWENPDALVLTDKEDGILHWSSAAESLFGYAAAEALGHRFHELVVPEGGDAPEQGFSARVTQGNTVTYRALRKHKDGSLVFVLASERPVRGEFGAGLLRTERDISQWQARRLTQYVQTRYGEFLESIREGVLLVTVAGRIVLANHHAAFQFGYHRDELSGMRMDDLLPKRHHGVHHDLSGQFFGRARGLPVHDIELHGMRRDGLEFPIEVSLSPVQTDDGNLIMTAVRDISDRMKAERKFRGLLESAPDAMVIVNQEGRIELVNSQAEALFGYRRDALLGQPVEMLIPERFRADHPTKRQGYVQHPRPRMLNGAPHLYGRRSNGSEFPVEISLSPIDTEEGILISSAIRDISERRHFEEMLQETNLQLRTASEAKDRFLAGMSHELRTPLNAIIGYTGTLLMRMPGPINEEQGQQLRTISGSAKHLLSLINDLLDLAKVESGKVALHMVTLPCHELIDEVVSVLRPLAEKKRIVLEKHMPQEHLLAHTDRRSLAQIVINLGNNAIKFTESGGTVALKLTRVMQDGRPCCEIAVSDTGRGIKPEEQAALFKAFSQLESTRPHEGTGLGLYLSKRLASMLGASLRFESQYGRGSTFSLAIPEHTAEAPAPVSTY